MQVNNATLTAPRLPSLRTFIAVDRPRRFRMTAETSFSGQEMDLGSNDDQYWIWIRRGERRAVYHGRHDRFYQSLAKEILPVPPTWLVEALGIVEFNPTGQHEGPTTTSAGQLEIRSRIPTPTGELIKVTRVDAQRGWVMQQEVYDARDESQLLASAAASDFNYYPEHGVSLPRSVQIELPPANRQFSLTIDNHVINQNHVDPVQMWSLPKPPGAELVDLNNLSSPPPNYVDPSYQTRARRQRFDYAQRIGRGPRLDQTRRQSLRRLPLLTDRFR